MWERIYVQSADVRFAVLQLISAARNELGLIKDQSAQTATRAMDIYNGAYIHICIYVIFKNRTGMLYRDLKHEPHQFAILLIWQLLKLRESPVFLYSVRFLMLIY